MTFEGPLARFLDGEVDSCATRLTWKAIKLQYLCLNERSEPTSSRNKAILAFHPLSQGLLQNNDANQSRFIPRRRLIAIATLLLYLTSPLSSSCPPPTASVSNRQISVDLPISHPFLIRPFALYHSFQPPVYSDH